MDQIVECVPNFSEGRNVKTIEAIADVFRKYPNVYLIDVDAGYSTNRTVYTICGTPRNVVDSIIDAAKVAFDLIDMRKHKGEHKRLGALDVCPYIPIKNLTMEDCSDLARETARRLSSFFEIPTYLYGFAASNPSRKAVPEIRKGEYEGLKEKLADPKWAPDFGPSEYTPNVARFGSTMCGSRKFLIAYNINIMSTKEQANKIAFDIREQGRGEGTPGAFKSVQAMGWTLAERNISQITINILDYEVTSIYQIWKEVNRRAKEYCLPICGSEIVGVVPLDAILDVANDFIEEEKILLLEEELKINYVVSKLGLNFLSEFKPKEKIIEYILEDKNTETKNLLVNLTLNEFNSKVRSRECVPGGGSVSALVGSLGFSLVTMIGRLSSGKKKFEKNDELMKKLLPIYYEASEKLMKFVDLDSQAYSRILESNRLPERTDEEQTYKQSSIRFANLNAIDVPKRLIEEIFISMQSIKELCPVINMSACSDLQVAINCFKAAVHGAYFNVLINLESINYNPELKERITREVTEKRDAVDNLSKYLLDLIDMSKASV